MAGSFVSAEGKNEFVNVVIPPIAGLAEDGFYAVVVAVGSKSDGIVAIVPVHAPAGECAGHLHDVGLGVAVALAHGEEFHEFASVVFIGLACHVDVAVEIDQHGGVFAHFFHESAEIAQRIFVQQQVVGPHEGVAIIHHLFGDEVIVPKECQFGAQPFLDHLAQPSQAKLVFVFKIQVVVVLVIIPGPVGPNRRYGIGGGQQGVYHAVGQFGRRHGQTLHHLFVRGGQAYALIKMLNSARIPGLICIGHKRIERRQEGGGCMHALIQ